MKKIIFFSLSILTFSLSAQDKIKVAQSSFRFGGGYSNYSGSNGLIFFNEAQFHIWKNFTVGPNIYFSRNVYGADFKNEVSNLYGVDLNAYYHIALCKTYSFQFGTGYGFRHVDNPNSFPQQFYIFDIITFPNTYGPAFDNYINDSQFIVNLNIEKRISDKWNIGLKSSWQPFGTQEAMYYVGLYGGVKF